jgi:dUTP pyrophosphatase
MRVIRFKKCDDVSADALTAPKYATDGSGCFDIFSIEQDTVGLSNQTRVFRTGLIPEVPEGWVLLLFSRSGHGFKHDVRLANCVGVIDSDYRGEMKVKLTADSCGHFTVNNGDAICQGLLVEASKWEIQLILDDAVKLSETGRGANGFGSTDLKRNFIGMKQGD